MLPFPFTTHSRSSSLCFDCPNYNGYSMLDRKESVRAIHQSSNATQSRHHRVVAAIAPGVDKRSLFNYGWCGCVRRWHNYSWIIPVSISNFCAALHPDPDYFCPLFEIVSDIIHGVTAPPLTRKSLCGFSAISRTHSSTTLSMSHSTLMNSREMMVHFTDVLIDFVRNMPECCLYNRSVLVMSMYVCRDLWRHGVGSVFWWCLCMCVVICDVMVSVLCSGDVYVCVSWSVTPWCWVCVLVMSMYVGRDLWRHGVGSVFWWCLCMCVVIRDVMVSGLWQRSILLTA